MFPRERASASSENCESRRDAHLLIPAYLCWCGCYQGRACRQESKRQTGSGQRDCLRCLPARILSCLLPLLANPISSLSLPPRGSSLKGSGSEPIRSRSCFDNTDRFSGKRWRRFSRHLRFPSTWNSSLCRGCCSACSRLDFEQLGIVQIYNSRFYQHREHLIDPREHPALWKCRNPIPGVKSV